MSDPTWITGDWTTRAYLATRIAGESNGALIPVVSRETLRQIIRDVAPDWNLSWEGKDPILHRTSPDSDPEMLRMSPAEDIEDDDDHYVMDAGWCWTTAEAPLVANRYGELRTACCKTDLVVQVSRTDVLDYVADHLNEDGIVVANYHRTTDGGDSTIVKAYCRTCETTYDLPLDLNG